MNKTLIVGHRGNIATRYKAVFNYLKLPWVGVDIGDSWPNSGTYEQVLICTPTDRHIRDCYHSLREGKRFLCEKPVSRYPEAIEELAQDCEKAEVRGSMVNNWWWACKIRFGNKPPITTIKYNYFHTGKDGVAWDCIQPIYLAERVEIKTDSPVFQCLVNGHEMTRFFFDASYVDMIKAWSEGNPLWTLADAQKATLKALKYEGCH